MGNWASSGMNSMARDRQVWDPDRRTELNARRRVGALATLPSALPDGNCPNRSLSAQLPLHSVHPRADERRPGDDHRRSHGVTRQAMRRERGIGESSSADEVSGGHRPRRSAAAKLRRGPVGIRPSGRDGFRQYSHSRAVAPWIRAQGLSPAPSRPAQASGRLCGSARIFLHERSRDRIPRTGSPPGCRRSS